MKFKKAAAAVLCAFLLVLSVLPAHAADATGMKVDQSSAIYIEDSDSEVLVPAPAGFRINPGDAFYIEILPEGGDKITTRTAAGYKVSADWAMGEKTVESCEIENRKVRETSTEYKYVAAIKTKPGFSVELFDLMGNIKIIKRTANKNTAADVKTIGTVVGYGRTAAGYVTLIDNDFPVADFKDTDESELTFGAAAAFTVGTRGQEKLFLGYSLKPAAWVLEQNPAADMSFISFKSAPTFNRIGDLQLFAEKESYVYEISGGKLKEVKATYDEGYDALLIKTRTLGSYVVSDRALRGAGSTQAAATGTGTASGSANSGLKPNPNTGR